MAVIYKATNRINGKSYIGYASNFKKRQIYHRSVSHRGKSYFHNAIKKHGWDNFEWSILKENATHEDEKYFIKEYNTFNDGYNLTLGGEGLLGFSPSSETREKISQSEKGKVVSGETKKRISDAGKGRRHSAEAKRKISETSKGRNTKNYTITWPTGISENISNLREFSKLHNWSYHSVHKSFRKYGKYKGINIDLYIDHKAPLWSINEPNGVL